MQIETFTTFDQTELLVKRYLTILILSLTIKNLSSQNLLRKDFVDLKLAIQNADSIFLVSHDQTDAIIIVDEQTGKKSLPQKVVVKGNLNNKIIHQKRNFPDSLKGTLINLLTKPVADRKIETCRTFIPFHSIILFRKGIASFIDVSHGCNLFSFETVKKSLGPYYIDKIKGEELIALFIKVGIDFDK